MRSKLFAILFTVALTMPAYGQVARSGDEIQKIIDSWRAEHTGSGPVMGGEIRLPARTRIHVDRPIDARGIWGFRLIGGGYSTQIVPRFDKSDAHAPILDLTGSARAQIESMLFKLSIAKPTVGCAILMARSGGESAGFHSIIDVHVEGMATEGLIIMVNSEVNTLERCRLIALNDHSPCFVFAAQNGKNGLHLDRKLGESTTLVTRSVDSTFSRYSQPIRVDGKLVRPDPSKFQKPVIWLKSGYLDDKYQPVRIGSFGDLEFVGGAIDGQGALSVLFTGEYGLMKHVRFLGLRCEAYPVKTWLRISTPNPGTGVSNFIIENSNFMVGERLVDASDTFLAGFRLVNTSVARHNKDVPMIEAKWAVGGVYESEVNYEGETFKNFLAVKDYARYCRIFANRSTINLPKAPGSTKGTSVYSPEDESVFFPKDGEYLPPSSFLTDPGIIKGDVTGNITIKTNGK